MSRRAVGFCVPGWRPREPEQSSISVAERQAVTAYDAVVFDNDGVLVEPPDYDRQVEAARAAFADHEVGEPTDADLAAVASHVDAEELRAVCRRHDLDVASLWEARNRYDRRFQREDLANGERTVYEDVDAIADCSPDRGVVSNNHDAIVSFVLSRFDLAEYFATSYGREPGLEALARKKPDPYYLELACADLGGAAVLYVGDRETDVLAAHNAGVDAALLRRPHVRDEQIEATPTYEIKSLRDLPPLVNGRGD